MINNNVLSAVLGFECIPYIEDDGSFWILVPNKNFFFNRDEFGFKKGDPAYKNSEEYPNGINIHELAHKCQEWAKEYHKNLTISVNKDLVTCYVNLKMNLLNINEVIQGGKEEWHVSQEYLIREKTYIDAIFKACEWIFDQIEKDQK